MKPIENLNRIGKGHCMKCLFYKNCPRMKGISYCYTARKKKSLSTAKVTSHLFDK